MILAAARRNTQHRLAVAITDAYFIEAKNISDADVLADIAADYGFDRDQAGAIALDPEQHRRAEQEAAKSAGAGVRSVPHFVFGEALPSMGGAAKTRLLRQYKRLPVQPLSDAASSHPTTRSSAYVKSIRFCGAVDRIGRCPTKKTGGRLTAVIQEATKGARSYDRPLWVAKRLSSGPATATRCCAGYLQSSPNGMITR
ncbi:DsbA family protein [Burkholderia cenocepacia]|uniref:DsbA family protein n=1 Tax=Burkholderia cenocepacia TaxID=95486 RepID=UPI00158CA182|nr:DsbA family protein [Burkholderia cenocepacia]